MTVAAALALRQFPFSVIPAPLRVLRNYPPTGIPTRAPEESRLAETRLTRPPASSHLERCRSRRAPAPPRLQILPPANREIQRLMLVRRLPETRFRCGQDGNASSLPI